MKEKEVERFKVSSVSSIITKQAQRNKKKQLPQNIKRYLLQDYTFLSEYQLLDSQSNSEFQFLAKIKSTSQMVKFKKKPFIAVNTPRGETMYKRFQVMHSLFQKGIILADNIFILEQANKQYFYYIIEPYLSSKQDDSTFLTLQQYLFQNRLNDFQAKKNLFIKCKNILDNLFLFEQSYCGLNSRKIVIDDQGDAFLLPFQLQPQAINKPYERSYYPSQVLKFISQQQTTHKFNLFDKWDIWSFGCVTLDIFLYLTPYFLSTSLQKQIQIIQEKIPHILKDFREQFINENMQKNQKTQSKSFLSEDQLKQVQDKRKILNFLMNVFNEDQHKRKFSFQPIFNEKEEFKSQRQRRSSRVKSSTRRLFQKTMQKSRQKIQGRTERYEFINYPSNQSSRILQQSKQVVEFKQLNICQKIANNKQKSNNDNGLYTLELKIKSLLQQDLIKSSQYAHIQLKIVVNFYNGEKFQFFINISKQNQQPQIPINRKITFLRRQMKFLQNLFEQDIQILLSVQNEEQNQERQAQILINLSALTIKNQFGERVWKKPIKGNYISQKGSDFQCKLKIEAEISGKDQVDNKMIKTRKINKSINQNKQNTKENQNSDSQAMTSRFLEPLKEKLIQKFQYQEKKDTFSKFSSIQKDKKQRAEFSPSNQVFSNTDQINNVLAQKMINENYENSKVTEILRQRQENNLQSKVKQLLQKSKKPEKLTQPIDFSKKLKRLLMK